MARAVENGVDIVAANTQGNVKDNTGSHGQSRIIQADGNALKEAPICGDDILVETLEIKPGGLSRPHEGLMADWLRQGVGWMLANRPRKLN